MLYSSLDQYQEAEQMSLIHELLKNQRHEDLWNMCCGFLDLDVKEFMLIQNNLLLEQIELLKKCQMGRKLLRGARPATVAEYRRQVPLTSYKDYCPELLEKREDVLPAKPVRWIQTSGRAGEYPFKWVPLSERFWDEAGVVFSAIAILSSCRYRGDIVIKDKMKLLHAASKPPTLTGAVAHRLAEDMGFRYLPSLDIADGLAFEDKVQLGFNQALSQGMDGFFGLAGVLVAIGKKFQEGSKNGNKPDLLRQPTALFRLGRGALRGKSQGRKILPRDIWKLKVITSMGTDCAVFRDKIEYLWGRKPLNVYGNTESCVIAAQTWDYQDMAFFPNLNFLEFIPEEEYTRASEDRGYLPRTILLDEVQPGKNYELVISSFHGGIMVRYRLGEIVRITSLSNDKLGINLPQMEVEGRADDLIDLGFMRLNERVIWEALENTGIPYKEWTAHKEFRETPRLKIYIELAPGYYTSSQDIADRLYQAIKQLKGGLYVYKDIQSIERLIDFKPIEVSILPGGVFSTYKKVQQGLGALINDWKPPHINPSRWDLTLLEAETAPEPIPEIETLPLE
jgi:hypothetical protein